MLSNVAQRRCIFHQVNMFSPFECKFNSLAYGPESLTFILKLQILEADVIFQTTNEINFAEESTKRCPSWDPPSLKLKSRKRRWARRMPVLNTRSSLLFLRSDCFYIVMLYLETILFCLRKE